MAAEPESHISQIRAVSEQDDERMAELFRRTYGSEPGDASFRTNPLGALIERPTGEIEMALTGSYYLDAVVALLADPRHVRTCPASAAENLKLLVEQMRDYLAQQPVRALMILAPRSFPELGEELRKLGFSDEQDYKIFSYVFRPEDGLASLADAAKPS